MSSINVAMVSGRLGGDPEMRYTPNGVAITKINVAVDNGYWNKDKGEWVDSVSWLTVTYFGALAELVAGKAEKGDMIYAGAKMVTEEFDAKDGTHVVRTAFKGTDFKVLFKKNAKKNKDDGEVETEGGIWANNPAPDDEEEPPWDEE